jgi:non-homologous end joining protein Ku
VRELVKEKAKGQKIVTAEEPAPIERGTVVNLIDALRKSVQGDKAAGAVKSPGKSAAAKKKAGTRR